MGGPEVVVAGCPVAVAPSGVEGAEGAALGVTGGGVDWFCMLGGDAAGAAVEGPGFSETLTMTTIRISRTTNTPPRMMIGFGFPFAANAAGDAAAAAG